MADREERHHPHQSGRGPIHLEVEDVLHHVPELVLVIGAETGNGSIVDGS